MYNYDTLYFFRRRIGLKNDSVHFVPIDSLDFTVGKYYYVYLHNGVNLAQQQYFMVHKDSLLKIRGNNLPNLPEDKYDGSTSSPHWFLDERSGLLYDMISEKVVENWKTSWRGLVARVYSYLQLLILMYLKQVVETGILHSLTQI